MEHKRLSSSAGDSASMLHILQQVRNMEWGSNMMIKSAFDKARGIKSAPVLEPDWDRTPLGVTVLQALSAEDTFLSDSATELNQISVVLWVLRKIKGDAQYRQHRVPTPSVPLLVRSDTTGWEALLPDAPRRRRGSEYSVSSGVSSIISGVREVAAAGVVKAAKKVRAERFLVPRPQGPRLGLEANLGEARNADLILKEASGHFLFLSSFLTQKVAERASFVADLKIPNADKYKAFVMPMCHGKTTLARKYGYIDFDSLICDMDTSRLNGDMLNAMQTAGWSEARVNTTRAASRVLAAMEPADTTIILVHDKDTAASLGIEVIASVVVDRDEFNAQNEKRDSVSMALGATNYRLVDSYPERVLCSDFQALEHFVLANAVRATKTGPGWWAADHTAHIHQAEISPLGFSYQQLVALAQKRLVSAGTVAYWLRSKEHSYGDGFGTTMNDWALALSGGFHPHRTKTVKYRSVHRDSMHALTVAKALEAFSASLDSEKDKQFIYELAWIHRSEAEEFVVNLITAWVRVIRFSGLSHVLANLLMIRHDRWDQTWARIHALLAVSGTIFGWEIDPSARQLLYSVSRLGNVTHLDLLSSTLRPVVYPTEPSLLMPSADIPGMLSQVVVEPRHKTFDRDAVIKVLSSLMRREQYQPVAKVLARVKSSATQTISSHLLSGFTMAEKMAVCWLLSTCGTEVNGGAHKRRGPSRVLSLFKHLMAGSVGMGLVGSKGWISLFLTVSDRLENSDPIEYPAMCGYIAGLSQGRDESVPMLMMELSMAMLVLATAVKTHRRLFGSHCRVTEYMGVPCLKSEIVYATEVCLMTMGVPPDMLHFFGHKWLARARIMASLFNDYRDPIAGCLGVSGLDWIYEPSGARQIAAYFSRCALGGDGRDDVAVRQALNSVTGLDWGGDAIEGLISWTYLSAKDGGCGLSKPNGEYFRSSSGLAGPSSSIPRMSDLEQLRVEKRGERPGQLSGELIHDMLDLAETTTHIGYSKPLPSELLAVIPVVSIPFWSWYLYTLETTAEERPRDLVVRCAKQVAFAASAGKLVSAA